MEYQTTHTWDIHDQRLHAVLEKLQWWEGKNAGHQSEKRKGQRYRYLSQQVVVVVSLTDERLRSESVSEGMNVSFPVYARNLSRQGLSFLIPREVFPRAASEDATSLNVEGLLKIDREIRIALTTQSGTPLWIVSRIVRFRPIHDGLNECGLQFLAKQPGQADYQAESPEAVSATSH